MQENLITIGRFGKVVGIKGWIKVYSFLSPQEEIFNFKNLFLFNSKNQLEEIQLNSQRRHFKYLLAKPINCDSCEQARAFVNSEIFIFKHQLPILPDGEYYRRELIGLDVVNSNGYNFGVVKEIISTGANDVLVIERGKKRLLIPYTSHVVIEADIPKKTICVDWQIFF